MAQIALEQRLLDAHAVGDGAALAVLYAQAADFSEAEDDIDAACFYLTHAFVFALESGAPERAELNARLVALGRDAPLPEGG